MLSARKKETIAGAILVLLLVLPAMALWRHSPGLRKVAYSMVGSCRSGGVTGQSLKFPNLDVRPRLGTGTVEIGSAANATIVEPPDGLEFAMLRDGKIHLVERE